MFWNGWLMPTGMGGKPVGCADIAAGYLESSDAFDSLLLTVPCGLGVLDHLDLGEYPTFLPS